MKKLILSFFIATISILSVKATTCGQAQTGVLGPNTLVCTGTNDIDGISGCGNTSYMGGEEGLIAYTPSSSGNLTIDYTGSTYTGIFVWDGCPSTGTCIGTPVTTSASSKSMIVSVTASVTYYIMIDTWPTPNSPCPGTVTLSLAPPSYCTPAPSSVDGSGITNISFGTPTSVNNTTGTETGNYGDFTSMIGDGAQGSTVNLDITYSTGYTYVTKVWVDWNNDLDFDDAGEEVYSGTSGSANPTTLAASFIVPLAQPLGNCRMRIGGADTGPPTPCYTGTYASFEDYTLNVTAAPACTQPSVLTSSNITVSSADLGWTENGSATTWNIEWGTAGFIQGAGTIVSTGSNPHSLTGLTSSTSYDFYVQADCGADSSAWAGPFAFTTSFQCPTNAICGNATPGDISTDRDFTSLPGMSTCPATITVVIPVGNIIDSVSTSYDMTAAGGGYMSEQRSWLYSPTTTTGEPAMISGTGSSGGTISYNRTGLTFANTASGTVDFELHAGRTYGGSVCDASYNKVDDGTWMVVAYYSLAPACSQPSVLTSSNITATSADLGWTENGSATTWNIEWGTAGFIQGAGTIVSTGSNPHNLTGLTSSTSYDFYVQADCGADSSAWAGPFAFTTLCGSAIAPWTEDFENGGLLPNCWNQGTLNSEDWLFGTTGGHVGNAGTIGGSTTSGNFFAWVDDSSPHNTGTALESPYIDVSSLTTPALYFYLISNNEGVSNVDFSVDVWDGTSWNTGFFSSNTNTLNGEWEEFIVNLTSLTITGDVQVRFIVDENNGTDFYDDVAIDDVAIKEAPSCYDPTLLTTSNFTSTSVDLGWTENGTALTWNIEWGAAGFVLGAGTLVSTGTNPYNLTGLTANTSYDFYVQADCGPDSSAWTGPHNFTTACNTINAFPFTEGFEDTSTTRSCWTNIQEVGGADWTFNTGSSGGSVTTAYSGSKNAVFVSSSGTNSPITKLVSPILDLSSLIQPRLSFYYAQEFWSPTQNYTRVLYRTSGMGPWTEIWADSNSVTSWTQAIIALPNPSATYQIAFEGINNWGRANVVDEVVIEETPSCVTPSALTISNSTTTSVDLGWTENGTALTWNIEWDTLGFVQGTGTMVSTGTNPYSLTGLIENTAYDFYVQADCGADSSAWAGPFSFSTLCGPISSFPYFMDFENGAPCWTANNGGDPNTWQLWSGAGDHTTGSGICAGILFDAMAHDDHFISPGIPVTIGTSERFAFWAKNQSLSYPDSCNVLVSTTGTAPADFTDTLAANLVAPAAWTEYVYDLSVYDGDTVYVSIHAISTNQWYLFVDDVMIDAYPPTCTDPSALTTTMLTSNSADLAWTENGTATLWNIEWDTSGFVQGSGTLDTTSSNPFSVNGLDPNTTYEFYVQANCGADSSAWVGPYSFTTPSEAVYINEIHYDNASTDTLEGIEIAGPAGTDLACYQLILYNGNNGTVYNTTSLAGIIPDQQCGFGTIWFPISGVQNGAPDGIVLYDTCSMAIIQFLSYEGSFAAVDLPAAGLISTDIGVSESTSTQVGESLQLIGNGAIYSDFTWAPASASTYNLVNTNQGYCPLDGGLLAITEPISGCGLSDSESVTVQIINYSLSATIYATDVSYSVNGGIPVSETVSSSILPGDTLTYTFMSSADLSAPGTFSINAWVTLGGDTNALNDSLIAYVVTSYALPAVGAGADTTICNGASVTLSGSGATTYSWDNGVSDGVPFTPDSTTTYNVTGTDTNGCQGTSSVTITVGASPIVDAGADTTICNGASVTLSGSGATTYTWDNGVTDGVAFMPSTTAMYTMTGSDTSACQGVDSVMVIVNALPTIDAGADVSVCDGESVTLSGSGASTYAWNNGISDGVSFTPSADETYIVTGTDSNGCQGTDSVDVKINAIPVAGFTSSSSGLDVSFTNSSSGATTYHWDFDDGSTGTDTDPTHTYSSAGTYNVCLIAISAENCSDTLCKDAVVSTTGIAGQLLLNNTYIFPNPSDGKVTLQIEGIKENSATITIKNSIGQVIYEELFTDLPISFEQELDLSMAPIGVYFLSIETDTQRATQKLVIE